MSTNSHGELANFRQFIERRLAAAEAQLSPEEALDLWRTENPLPQEFAETTAALREALADLAAGDTGVPLEEFDRQFLRETEPQFMRFTVSILRRAQGDVDEIYEWIARQSPTGAVRWYAAFCHAANGLRENANRCAQATESSDLGIDIRQRLFRDAPWQSVSTTVHHPR